MIAHVAGLDHSGGCHPASTQRARAHTRRSSLSPSARTVALPVGVSPIMCTLSSPQAKCSAQPCVLGLNSGARSPVCGSTASVRVALASLHRRQESHKFSSISCPPLALGMICSRVNGTPLTTSCVKQYPHRLWASSAMRLRSVCAEGLTWNVPALGQAGERHPAETPGCVF